jgi:DNA-directed RNA polymerase subunit RPC12/RpoP
VTAPPPAIVCVDCGETAHLLSVRGDGDQDRVAVYRCSGCWDRWDVVLETDTARVGPEPVLREGESTDSP